MIQNAKVLTVSEVLPYCCIVPKDDLFCFDLKHPRWQKLISQCIIYRSYADKQTLKESFDNLKKNVLCFILLNLVEPDKCNNEHNESDKKITIIEFDKLVSICKIIKIFDEDIPV